MRCLSPIERRGQYVAEHNGFLLLTGDGHVLKLCTHTDCLLDAVSDGGSVGSCSEVEVGAEVSEGRANRYDESFLVPAVFFEEVIGVRVVGESKTFVGGDPRTYGLEVVEAFLSASDGFGQVIGAGSSQHEVVREAAWLDSYVMHGIDPR